MNRTLKTTATASAAALLLIVGCSTGGGKEASTTTTSKPATTTTASLTTTTEGPRAGTVALDEWADGFCGAFADWTSGVQDIGTDAEDDLTAATTPAETREAVVATFDGAATLTDDFIAEVEAQDPPEMDDGEGMVSAFTSKFQEFGDVIETSRSRAEAIDLDAPDFIDQVKAIYTDFEQDFAAVGDSFGEIDRKYPDPEFQRALTSACGL